MKDDCYIGLFRALPRGKWHVKFPDLPGCEARAESFKEALRAAQEALANYLSDLEEFPPRARSTAELLIDAQRDWVLCRDFVDAVMHPVHPVSAEERAPLDLVAASRGGHPGPQIAS